MGGWVATDLERVLALAEGPSRTSSKLPHLVPTAAHGSNARPSNGSQLDTPEGGSQRRRGRELDIPRVDAALDCHAQIRARAAPGNGSQLDTPEGGSRRRRGRELDIPRMSRAAFDRGERTKADSRYIRGAGPRPAPAVLRPPFFRVAKDTGFTRG